MILELIRDNPGISIRDISATIGISMEKARTVLYELKAKGYVEKTGRTYILTDKGKKFLEYIEHARATTVKPETVAQDTVHTIQEEPHKEILKQPSVETQTVPKTTEKTKIEVEDIRTFMENILVKISDLEKRVSNIERTVRDIEKAIESVQRKKQPVDVFLEVPLMPYGYAATKLGSILDKLIAENKLVRIGSLVVDSQFYNEFKSKFPIKLSDLDKLTLHERTLLEEMRKEALVILHAGREYRLID